MRAVPEVTNTRTSAPWSAKNCVRTGPSGSCGIAYRADSSAEKVASISPTVSTPLSFFAATTTSCLKPV